MPPTGSYAVLARWIQLSTVILSLILVPAAHAWERGDVLEAIHQVENPYDTMRIGRRGELGPFQFRPVVWRMYTQKPFSLAADRTEAQAVAEMHFEWIRKGLERNRLEVTPYYIGLVWNAGLQATLNGRASATSLHYAQRVANLVEYATKPAILEPAATVEKNTAPSATTAAAAL
jgi:hypothetical protein